MTHAATVTSVDLVNMYQTSGRFHPYTCACPTPIRDEDPPRAVLVDGGIRLRCVRCDFDQEFTERMLFHANAVMSMPTTPFGDIFPRCIPDPRPAVSQRAWRDTLIVGFLAGFAIPVAALAASRSGWVAVVVGVVIGGITRRLVLDSHSRAQRTFNHG